MFAEHYLQLAVAQLLNQNNFPIFIMSLTTTQRKYCIFCLLISSIFFQFKFFLRLLNGPCKTYCYFYFHLRSISRQVGGWRRFKFKIVSNSRTTSVICNVSLSKDIYQRIGINRDISANQEEDPQKGAKIDLEGARIKYF